MSQPSYTRGRQDQALLTQTIGQAFDATVARCADAEALVSRHQGLRYSWRELAEQVEVHARALMALGVNTGERVGIWSPNCAQWCILQLASAKVGAILVNINPAYRVGELEYVLRQSGCRWLVCADAFKTSDYHAMVQELVPELACASPGKLVSERLPDLRGVISLAANPPAGFLRWHALAEKAGQTTLEAFTARQQGLQFDQPVNIQYTSGTTGAPKGATLSHYNILNNGFMVGESLGLTACDRMVIPVPLYHCFGMVLGNLACFTHGSCIVYPNDGFDALSVLEAVQAERCTGLHGVPTMFIAELQHPQFQTFDLSTLRTGIMAGSPCPIEVMKRVVRDMHLSEITIAYGMTETSPVSCQSDAGTPLEKRVATVGKVQPHLEVKVIDPDTGATVAPGTSGELCTKGYSVMHGYWGDEAKTREAIDAEGWMHTGDLATMDAEGYVNIVGRIKDMVIRGGENIYPREIEEFLYRHPKIQDVQVVGLPDSRYGEELCAWIIAKPGESLDEDGVRSFCQGQIAHYKVPRYIRFVDAFPMTVTGKIQKFRIREEMVEQLQLTTDRTA